MVAPESRHVAITPSFFAADLGRPQHEVAGIGIAVYPRSVPGAGCGPNVAAALLAELPLIDPDMLIAGLTIHQAAKDPEAVAAPRGGV